MRDRGRSTWISVGVGIVATIAAATIVGRPSTAGGPKK